jgi:poly(A) polymerase/tRNA nucleotidyltransferase (CCA-adding enzyme)
MSGLLHDAALAPILAALPRARLVGGCVRDMLAGRPIADIDLATPDPPEAILQALAQAGIRAIPTGLAHGTITALQDGTSFEITALRQDLHSDGRHARVAWTDDFRADAARRDFTINAMSMDRAGQLHDYYQGAADLRAGRVRFVGDPATRIAEDRLRILRFFRFQGRYGTQPPDAEAQAAIAASVAGLRLLSAERVWSEVKRILAIDNPAPTVALMAQLGALAVILPEAQDIARLNRLIAAGAPADPMLRLAALLTASPAALADRLKLSNAERDRLMAMHPPARLAALESEAGLRRHLAETPAETLADRAWLTDPATAAPLAARLAALTPPVFPLEGRHALALGASPGPRIGEALRAVRQWWLEGGCTATEAECLAKLANEL